MSATYAQDRTRTGLTSPSVDRARRSLQEADADPKRQPNAQIAEDGHAAASTGRPTPRSGRARAAADHAGPAMSNPLAFHVGQLPE